MTVAQEKHSPAIRTLADALERASLVPEAGVRFVDRREQATWRSWSEILAGAEGVASTLAERGVGRGDRVALVFPTSPELVEAFFGVVLAGGVPACLVTPPRLGRLEPYRARVRKMLEAIDAREVLCEGRIRDRLGDPLLRRAPAGRASRLPSAAGPEDELAMIQFTSGTTRTPMPVGLSHAAVLEQARLLNANWPDGSGRIHKGASWLPLHHDMGLIGFVFTALERPGEITLLQPEVFAARPALWLRTISAYGATISAASNFAYAYCAERVRDDELDGVDLSSWRIALNGAEPVRSRTMRRFAERFAKWGFDPNALTPVYGLAEASLGVTFGDLEAPYRSRRFDRRTLSPGASVRESGSGVELVSVGRPLNGVEVSIRDADGSDLEEGVVGRIWVRGPSLMSGYLGRERASRKALRDGWLDTGDCGFRYCDELYVSGRAKETLIVRGRNHSPADVEHAAEEVRGVPVGRAAAVAHAPEAGDREEIFLFVELERRHSKEATARLKDDCRRSILAETGLEIDHVVVLPRDGIARTSSGKIRRAATLEGYLEQAGARS